MFSSGAVVRRPRRRQVAPCIRKLNTEEVAWESPELYSRLASRCQSSCRRLRRRRRRHRPPLFCGGGAALTKGRLFVIATKEKNKKAEEGEEG